MGITIVWSDAGCKYTFPIVSNVAKNNLNIGYTQKRFKHHF